MIRWLKNHHRVVLAEADEFMEFYGDRAYAEARKEMRAARRRGDRRQEKFFTHVALEIAKRTEIEVGRDTATRYVEEQAPYEPGPAFVRNPGTTFH